MVTNSLRRDLTPLNSFGITFSTVGVLWIFTRDPLSLALLHGGPVLAVWGWLAVSCLNLVNALCLAELASCMPAAIGSIYIFTARLSPWQCKAAATWVAAWANMAGALGATAYYALVTTRVITSAARLARISASDLPYDPADPSYALSSGQQFGIYAAVLASWLGLVVAPLGVTAGFITGCSLWQICGGAALFAALLALAPHRNPASFVFGNWFAASKVTGITSPAFNVLNAILFGITAQFGYEAVLYFVEEIMVHRRRRQRKLGGGGGGGGGGSDSAPGKGAAAAAAGKAPPGGLTAATAGGDGGGRSNGAAPARANTGGGGGVAAATGVGWRSQSYVPEAMWGGLLASCALSWAFVTLLLAAVPSLPHAVDPRNETLGKDPFSQIVYDILKAAYGSGSGSPGLIAVLTIGVYSNGLVVAAGTTRKLWAMSSDGFLPLCISAVYPLTHVPVRAAALAVTVALIPGLLLFESDWAAGACVSYVPLAYCVSYLVPISLRLLPGSGLLSDYDSTTRRVALGGGFTLGRASRPLFAVSTVWLVLCIGLCLLPPAWPLEADTANWAPVSAAALFATLALSWWLPRWGARRWFRGLASVGGVSYG
ncbi:hypothetical protein HYH03_013776 [Edaphochlamys debaryana]|uniref:Uncharacterized protein n=1 Tax=Edaphochlamys debaryana TaxID=47281 RepID=A0A835XP53_9CHLO|nr:hypothetical protein HYH03_013776 [Edaphochlamys debaryana]|eukprot:KAG2487638.1 hypothetical protein HYH03_013776 [Edaphochlamys debaryana]